MTRPKAILFDMDGTLTEPLLDFDLIRREMGITGKGILENLARMPVDQRERAEGILLRHEREAADKSRLNPGCHELLAAIDGRLPRAVITRNSRESTDTVCRRHGLRFDLLVTREFGQFKPDPAPVLHACQALNVLPAETWMVGDGQFDIEAGIAAGVHTIWLSHRRPRYFAAEPWQTVVDLLQLTALLRDCLAG
jgi:HAD superfamily hydrolase (TIGR01509 family)